MAEVRRLPDIASIERKASEWIARLNSDDVSTDDRTRFEAWCRAHPLHARAYEEMSTTWRAFTAAGPVVRAVSFGHSMNEAARVGVPKRKWLAACVAALAVVAAGLLWYLLPCAFCTRFQTAIGEHATVSLPDGSTLELNSNSVARLDYSDQSRVIRLDRGEAFFKVAHDIARPFWVVSGGTWVRAVGTAFNVDVRSDSVRVTVTEGTVKVGAIGSLVNRAPSDEGLAQSPASTVTAGQEANLEGSATVIRTLRNREVERSEAWRSGTVYFENQPLSEVAEELGRYTKLQLVVEDEHLRGLLVGGTFGANPQGAEAFLMMLKDGLGLNVRRENGRVYIETEDNARPHSR